VIGAGPAGITIAVSLARAGRRVLLLESGGHGRDRATQDFSRGQSIGEPYAPLHLARVRGFGGTSLHWVEYGRFRATPLAPLDFEARADVPHSGWPIDRADLDPFYEQAMPWCGLGPWDFSVKRWASDDRPALPFVTRSASTVVFQLAEVDTWVKRFDEVRTTKNLRLLLHAHVTDIRVGHDGNHVESLGVRTMSGTSFEVRPRTTVLAAGGIENARMLLANRDRHPNGIGNGHDLVGRFFQEHLMIRGGVIRSADPSLADNLNLYLKHRNDDGTRIHAKFAVDEQVVRERGLLNCVFFLTRVGAVRAHAATRSLATLLRAPTWRPRPQRLGWHLGRVVRGAPQMARAAARQFRAGRSDTLQLVSEAEQAPNPDSRVTLHATRRDAFGLPQACLDWRLTELDRTSIVRSQDLMDRALRQSGIGRLDQRVGSRLPAGMITGHGHHMGTARMHDDPRKGVVDRNCRVHGLRNLYVAGSAVFPTSGYANPTLTVVALALRLAEYLTTDGER
jgi:choline dehydrogenase-like flavoprotein